MYEELIQQARELCEKGRKSEYSVSIENCIVGLCDALEATEKENERLQGKLQDQEYQIALDAMAQSRDEAIARAEKAEAERDVANKCIYDTETYFDLCSNKFAYRTIKQYTHDATKPPKEGE